MEAILTTLHPTLSREAGIQRRAHLRRSHQPAPPPGVCIRVRYGVHTGAGMAPRARAAIQVPIRKSKKVTSAGRLSVWMMILVLLMASVSFGCGALTAAARQVLPSDNAVQALPAARLSFLRGSLPKAAGLAPLSGGQPAGLAKQAAAPPIANAPVRAEPLLPAEPGYTSPSYMPPSANPGSQPAIAPTPTPLTLPEYEIPAPTPAPQATPVAGLPFADDSPATRLVIGRMGLDAVVKYVPFSNNTWLIGGLRHEIAWMGDTSWPGLGGNTGLAGHYDFVDGSPGPFWRLSELRPGDSVELYTEQAKYTYTVRTQTLVDDDDVSVIAPTENAQITLITCAGWDRARRVYAQRLIVYADLTGVESLR